MFSHKNLSKKKSPEYIGLKKELPVHELAVKIRKVKFFIAKIKVKIYRSV